MQSSLYFAASNPPVLYSPFPWKNPHRTNYLIPSKPSLKPLTLSYSLKTSFDYQLQQGNLDKPDEPTSPARLPVVICGAGGVSRYVWDGSGLKLVPVDGNNSVSLSLLFSDFEDGFRKLFRICSLGVWNFFLPREVSGNYLEYVKWEVLAQGLQLCSSGSCHPGKFYCTRVCVYTYLPARPVR